MKLNIQDVPWPPTMHVMASDPRCQLVRCCRVNGWMHAFITIDAGRWHMSISHPRRYPTWDEMKAARYTLLPRERTFAFLFPPPAQYVNLHENCFHLHEAPELHELTESLIVPVRGWTLPAPTLIA